LLGFDQPAGSPEDERAEFAQSVGKSLRNLVWPPAVLPRLFPSTSGTDAGIIYVFDEAIGEFQLRAANGMSAELIAALHRALRRDCAGD
jgi:hypothetical protein